MVQCALEAEKPRVGEDGVWRVGHRDSFVALVVSVVGYGVVWV